MAPRMYECLRKGCGWENELYPEEAQDVCRAHASHFGSDHVVTAHDKPQEVELLEEDKNNQACETALERVVQPPTE